MGGVNVGPCIRIMYTCIRRQQFPLSNSGLGRYLTGNMAKAQPDGLPPRPVSPKEGRDGSLGQAICQSWPQPSSIWALSR